MCGPSVLLRPFGHERQDVFQVYLRRHQTDSHGRRREGLIHLPRFALLLPLQELAPLYAGRCPDVVVVDAQHLKNLNDMSWCVGTVTVPGPARAAARLDRPLQERYPASDLHEKAVDTMEGRSEHQLGQVEGGVGVIVEIGEP